MGLNLETLIGILVILILLILADGLRRMLRERSGRLRVRIDPSVRQLGDDELADQRNPELPGGGARVVGRRAPAVKTDVAVAAEDDVAAPPVVMEKEEQPPEPVVEATQQDLFSGQAPQEDEAQPEAEASRQKEILEVIVLHMVANPGVRIPGRELLRQLLEQGLRFGEMNIFHRHRQTASGSDELLFSMANALEPGTFDIDSMEDNEFRAVTFFLKLPGPARPLDALDRMLSSARKLADGLDADLRDEQHSVLTPQTIEHLRQRVQDFERRQRLADVQ